MASSFNDDRRVLSYPGQFPQESLPPATLFTSLTSLAVNICNFKTSFFPTQRRNAIETIRHVSVILNFLREREKEIPEHYYSEPCFSELQFYLQKILFLLQDCTRQGARLLMLLNSREVALKFQALIGGVAVALQSLSSIPPAKESVELLTKQVVQTKLELDPDDEKIRELADLSLSELGMRMKPSLTCTKEVLDYLGIKTWSDCDREISFLQDEISFRHRKELVAQTPALSGMSGLLTYCRVVIFESETNLDDFENPTSKPHPIMWDPVEAFAMECISRFIAERLEFGTMEQKKKAAYEMSLLAGTRRGFINDCLVEAGTVPHLLHLLSTNDKGLQANVFTALGRVSPFNRKVGIPILERGSELLKPIILRVLRTGLTPASRASAAALVHSLSQKIKYDQELSAEAISGLMELIKEGTTIQEKREAMVAISGILSSLYGPYEKENYQRVVEANIVGLLLQTLTLDDSDDLMTYSLDVLVIVARDECVGREAIIKEWDKLGPVIIGIMKSTHVRRRKEQCTLILLSLCESGSGNYVKRALARDKSIMAVLFSLYSDCTCALASEAASLVSILHDSTLHD